MLHLSASPLSDLHDTGLAHPERPARVPAVLRGLAVAGLEEAVDHVAPRQATRPELELAHSQHYLDWLEEVCHRGGAQVDPDTVASPGSWETALCAAGGLLGVVEAVEKAGGTGLSAHRPPGHHATRDQAMGFCLLNNVAIATAYLLAEGRRVAIVDWDVHHGNGTQAIFWDEPKVLYLSTHQSPLYPGTGASSARGGDAARGTTINVPLPPGATGDVVARAFEEVFAPAVDVFAPDWVLVSCGFDGHRADPLAQFSLSAGDFAGMARLAASWAPGGRLVLALEGGYDLAALTACTGAVASALLGGSYQPEAPTGGGPGRAAVEVAKKAAAERC